MWERLEIYKHVHDIDYKVLNALESIKIITRIDTSLHFLIGVKIVIFCILIAGKQTMEYFFSIQKNVFFNNKKSNKKKKKSYLILDWHICWCVLKLFSKHLFNIDLFCWHIAHKNRLIQVEKIGSLVWIFHGLVNFNIWSVLRFKNSTARHV
jgi:hypothetical protein